MHVLQDPLGGPVMNSVQLITLQRLDEDPQGTIKSTAREGRSEPWCPVLDVVRLYNDTTRPDSAALGETFRRSKLSLVLALFGVNTDVLAPHALSPPSPLSAQSFWKK